MQQKNNDKVGVGKALSRSYGCFFAEFLGDHSLVRLGLLDLITCVGLRYGFYIFKFRDFSWKRALYYCSHLRGNFLSLLELPSKALHGFSYTRSLRNKLQI